MWRLLILGALALSLGACQTKPNLAAYTDEVKLGCGVASVGYAIWEAQYATKTKAATAAKVRAAYAGIVSVCANPPSSEAGALLSALTAVQAFNSTLAAAQAAP